MLQYLFNAIEIKNPSIESKMMGGGGAHGIKQSRTVVARVQTRYVVVWKVNILELITTILLL